MSTWVKATLALSVAATTGADVLPPGEKPVTHEIFVAGTEDFPEYAFYIGPVSMTGGVEKVTPGQSLSFYKLAGPLLWAVKEPVVDAPTVSDLRGSKNPRSEKPFFSISSVPESDPTTHIRTTFTVKSIENGIIRLERADRRSQGERAPSDGALALLALAGVLGLTIVARQSR